MLKYQGTYRVKYETDKAGKPQEFTYIPCRIKQGANICRHSDNVLNVHIPSMKIILRLLSEYPGIFTMWQDCAGEGTILFPESLISEVAVILKAQTRGKTLTPRPQGKHNLSDEQRKRLADNMDRVRSQRKLSR